MDYRLKVYPSSEQELKNVKTDNDSKQIQMLVNNQPQALYKKHFGAAVKRYNEKVVSGGLIGDYYKAIVGSNIPELYKLDLMIRYDIGNKTEIAAIQKAFMSFKKEFEKEEKLCLVAAYIFSFDEIKELLLFFFPISNGYMTGLSVRADFIDVTRAFHNISDKEDKGNRMTIGRAIPLFEQTMIEKFNPINNGQFLSQEELENLAKSNHEADPMKVHSIEVEILKKQMADLNKLKEENEKLEETVKKEKTRIEHDIGWSKAMEEKILFAEQERIAAEQRRIEQERLAEIERQRLEAQMREEERLRDEERRIAAENLAAQTRRNIALRKQLSQEKILAEKNRAQRYQIEQHVFEQLIHRHMEWQQAYNITADTVLEQIPIEAKNDKRRLSLFSADIENVNITDPLMLIGVSFYDCSFKDVQLNALFVASEFTNCKALETQISNLQFRYCAIVNLDIKGSSMTKITFAHTSVVTSNLQDILANQIMCEEAVSFAKCNFNNAGIKDSDLKAVSFINSDFTKTKLVRCDCRNTSFKICKLGELETVGSLFRGSVAN